MSRRFVSSYKKLALGVSISCLGLLSQQALSQQGQQQEVEEITVTGSFIQRPADRPQPVSVLDNQEIEANQRVTLTQVIRDMPQVQSANVTSNSLDPTNSINLRGLGSRATLTLLNGQRQTMDANEDGAVDIDNLAPSIMVERMELLTDGASALYGADAVAGVANFITRDTFEGAEFRLTSQHADAQPGVPEVTAAGIVGSQGTNFSSVMAVEYAHRADQLKVEELHDVDRIAKGLPTAFYNPGTFQTVDGSFYPDPLCGSEQIGGNGRQDLGNPAGFDDGTFCRGVLTWQRAIIPETKQLTGMAVGTYQFTDSEWLTQARISGNYAKATMVRHEGGGLPYLALLGIDFTMPATNPGVIEANRNHPEFPLTDYSAVWSRMMAPVDDGVDMKTKQWTTRATASLDGIFPGTSWDWDVTGTFSQNDQFSQDVDVIAERLVRSLEGYGGPNCDFNPVTGAENTEGLERGEGFCQYYNPFANRLLAEPGDPHHNSQELENWIQWGETPMGHAQLWTAQGVATGDLWEMAGGPTGIAVGAQYRRQFIERNRDPIQKDGGFAFAPQVLRDWDATLETEAVFSELVMYPTDDLELNAAARYESTSGESTADFSSVEPKVSFLWTPTDTLFIRGTVGSSFRAPSPFEMFGLGEGGGTTMDLGGRITQARGFTVGNPDLEPEESENWNLGFTWDVTPSLTLEATYWDFEFTGLVTSTDAEQVLLQDIQDGFIDNTEAHPLFPGRPNEVCEITGRWDPDSGDPLPEGCVTGFDIQVFRNQTVNRDRLETNGVDFTIDYGTNLFGGEFGTSLNATYVNSFKGNDEAGELLERAGTDGHNAAGVGTNPQWRANLVHTFDIGNHSFRGTWRYNSGIDYLEPDDRTQEFSSEASYTQFDFVYNYTMGTAGQSQFTFAVLNVTDRKPPVVADGLTTTNSGLHDPRGRMGRIALSYSF